jgi:hypothetical protein
MTNMKTAIIVSAAIALFGCDKQPVGRFQLFAGTYEVSYSPSPNGDVPASSEKIPGVFLLDTATGQIWKRIELISATKPGRSRVETGGSFQVIKVGLYAVAIAERYYWRSSASKNGLISMIVTGNSACFPPNAA